MPPAYLRGPVTAGAIASPACPGGVRHTRCDANAIVRRNAGRISFHCASCGSWHTAIRKDALSLAQLRHMGRLP